jgi:hypothetical protein
MNSEVLNEGGCYLLGGGEESTDSIRYLDTIGQRLDCKRDYNASNIFIRIWLRPVASIRPSLKAYLSQLLNRRLAKSDETCDWF